MNPERLSPDAATAFPLRAPLLALLIYGCLIHFLELTILIFGRRRAAGEGFTASWLPILTVVHTLFAALLLADAILALRSGARRPARLAFETGLALAVLWALQRSAELMALSF